MESQLSSKGEHHPEKMDANDTSKDVPQRKRRKRVKKLCGLIKDQIEFYFSDANLHRDRFLKKQMDQSSDGFVDLDMFVNFNKIRNLTTDVSLIAKALTNSELLKVSEDKKKVKRVTPLEEVGDADDRTVYVECLPASADHDYLRKLFSNCGQVLYVSLPKYRSSGDIKGFAFIEMDSRESAMKACEMMNNPPAGVGNKVGRFPKSSKQLDTLNKQLAAQSQKPGLSEDSETDPGKNKRRKRSRSGSDSAGEDKAQEEKPQRKGRKRRASQSESGEESTPVSSLKRKSSLKDDAKDDDSAKEETRTTDKKQKRKRSNDDGESETVISKKSKSQTTTESTETTQRLESSKSDQTKTEDGKSEPAPPKQESIMKKDPDANSCDKNDSSKRKRKSEGGDGLEVKKVRISEKVEVKVAEDEGKKRRKKKKKKKDVKLDIELPELRVMPKSEWLELKKEYIQLQKESMRDLKQALCQHRLKEQASKIVGLGEQSSMTDGESVKKEGKQMEFIPNVILKVSSAKEICRKQLKESVKPYGEIAYVDVPEGQMEGFVRCPDPENAARIAEAGFHGYTFQKLTGDEEKTYWDKILADREKKLNSKTRTKRRGRDKVMKQADTTTREFNKKKHVFFN